MEKLVCLTNNSPKMNLYDVSRFFMPLLQLDFNALNNSKIMLQEAKKSCNPCHQTDERILHIAD